MGASCFFSKRYAKDGGVWKEHARAPVEIPKGRSGLISTPNPTAPETKVYSYNAVISSCQNGSQWQRALLLYEAMDGVS